MQAIFPKDELLVIREEWNRKTSSAFHVPIPTMYSAGVTEILQIGPICCTLLNAVYFSKCHNSKKQMSLR